MNEARETLNLILKLLEVLRGGGADFCQDDVGVRRCIDALERLASSLNE